MSLVDRPGDDGHTPPWIEVCRLTRYTFLRRVRRLSRQTYHPPTALASEVVTPDELASIAEIAAMLGVTERTAQRYAERSDFPAPLETIAGGRIRVWRRADVDAWAATTLPLPRPGRPPKKN
jgi:predicted DNA-binding transcriptional regulator AlpA